MTATTNYSIANMDSNLYSYQCRASATAICAVRSNNQSYIAVNAGLSKIDLLQVDTGREISRFSNHFSCVTHVASVGPTIVSADTNRNVIAWNAETQAILLSFQSNLDKISHLSAIENSKTGGFFIVTSSGRDTLVVDEQCQIVFKCQGSSFSNPFTSIIDGSSIIFCLVGFVETPTQMNIVDLSTGKLSKCYNLANTLKAKTELYELGASTVAAGDENFMLRVMEATEESWRGGQRRRNNLVGVWDTHNGEYLGALAAHTADVLCITLLSSSSSRGGGAAVDTLASRFRGIAVTGGKDHSIIVSALGPGPFQVLARLSHPAWVRALQLTTGSTSATGSDSVALGRSLVLLSSGDHNALRAWNLDDAMRGALWTRRKNFAMFLVGVGLLGPPRSSPLPTPPLSLSCAEVQDFVLSVKTLQLGGGCDAMVQARCRGKERPTTAAAAVLLRRLELMLHTEMVFSSCDLCQVIASFL